MRDPQQSLESLESITEASIAIADDEVAALQTHGKCERSRADTLRPRLYADARSLTNPLLKVRNLSHDARAEAIA